jgi:hypothetical protein
MEANFSSIGISHTIFIIYKLGMVHEVPLWQKRSLGLYRMDILGPTTLVGTRTDYLVGPWDYLTCAARHMLAWSARTIEEIVLG